MNEQTTVWVVYEDYCGVSIIGVFTCQDAAERKCNESNRYSMDFVTLNQA